METQESKMATLDDLLLLEKRLKTYMEAMMKGQQGVSQPVISPDQVARMVGLTAEASYRESLKEYFGDLFREILGRKPKANFSDGTNLLDEPMVGVKEAAEITGLAVNTLYEKTCQKAIPHYKKGKRLYFRPSELLAWIGKGRIATQEEIDAKASTYIITNPIDARKKGRNRK